MRSPETADDPPLDDRTAARLALVSSAALVAVLWFRFGPGVGGPQGADHPGPGARVPALVLADVETAAPRVVGLGGPAGRVVWVTFWAASAPAAGADLAALEPVWARLRSRSRFTMVAAAVESDRPEVVRAARDAAGTTIPVAVAPPATRRAFGVEARALPIHVLIDEEGRVVALARDRDEGSLERLTSQAERRLDDLEPLGRARFAARLRPLGRSDTLGPIGPRPGRGDSRGRRAAPPGPSPRDHRPGPPRRPVEDAPAMIDPRVASGLRDIPPSAMIPRERMLASFRETFAAFGFLPIETPHIERMEVLTGKGAGSDEVLRQIFDVTNKGGTPGELALRFDLTVPLARFVAKHVNDLGTPFKRYAIGSVFRGERPAKGRFREFVQCDFDTVGSESPVSDAETAQVIHAALSAAGVPAFTISLNNRKVLDGLLDSLGLADRSGPVLRVLDKLAKVGREKVLAELQGAEADDPHGPLLTADQAARVLAFVEQGRGGVEVLAAAETALGTHPRAAEGIANLRAVFDLLAVSNVPAERLRVDLGLARGLDYYTGIVYETTVDGWEKFGSVSSGGRYDDLASLFTERRLPGVGASIGLDRLLALLEEAGWRDGTTSTTPVLVANFPGTDPAIAVRLAAELRAAGIGAEVFPDPIQIGKQMGYGSSRGHLFAVIVGPEEASQGLFNLRDLATREEHKGIEQHLLVDSVHSALAVARHEDLSS